MEKRILELAVEALQLQKASVEAEIEAVRGELQGAARVYRAAIVSPAAPKRRRKIAQRKAQSERMKAYWAARKAAAAKPKFGPRSAAARKAQSERMKAYWARKRKEKRSKTSA
jgi:hypothetical protein